MGQITGGIRSILSHPFIYNAFQNFMGAPRLRREFLVDFVRPESGQRILDIGCGTADILDFIPSGLSYIGYDPSELYIQHAMRRFGDKGEFHIGFFNQPESKKHAPFDIVLATGLLHHMDDAHLTSMMSLAHSVLKPGGRLVTIDPVFFTPQNPIAKMLIKMDRGQNVRTAKAYTELASPIFSAVTGLVRHRVWVPYTHWIMECKK